MTQIKNKQRRFKQNSKRVPKAKSRQTQQEIRHRKRKTNGEVESVEQKGGLTIKFINTYIGSGVFAKANIEKDAFVCAYSGEIHCGKEGETRLKLN